MHHIKKTVSRTDLVLQWKKLGGDYMITLTGGDEHVGAVAVGNFDKDSGRSSSSVITCPGHRETEIAMYGAKVFSDACMSASVFIVGIHLEDITKDEIEEIVSVSEEMIKELTIIIREGF